MYNLFILLSVQLEKLSQTRPQATVSRWNFFHSVAARICLSFCVLRWFSSVTIYFFSPKRLTPDPSDQNEKVILSVPENFNMGFAE